MSLTDVQKAKIILAIDSHKRKIEDLKKSLAKEEAFNRSAWNEYGSELCGASMSAKEDAFRKEIFTTIGEMYLFDSVLTGEISLPELENLPTKMEEIIEREKILAVEKKTISRELEKLAVIKKVLQE